MANNMLEESENFGGWLSTQKPPKGSTKDGQKKINSSRTQGSILRQTRIQTKPRPSTLLAMAELDLLNSSTCPNTRQSSLLQFFPNKDCQKCMDGDGKGETEASYSSNTNRVNTSPINKIGMNSNDSIDCVNRKDLASEEDIIFESPCEPTENGVNGEMTFSTESCSSNDGILNSQCDTCEGNRKFICSRSSDDNDKLNKSIRCTTLSLKSKVNGNGGYNRNSVINQRCILRNQSVESQLTTIKNEDSIDSILEFEIKTSSLSQNLDTAGTTCVCKTKSKSLNSLTSLKFSHDDRDTDSDSDSTCDQWTKRRKTTDTSSSSNSFTSRFSDVTNTDTSFSCHSELPHLSEYYEHSSLRASEKISKEKYKELMGTLVFSDMNSFSSLENSEDTLV